MDVDVLWAFAWKVVLVWLVCILDFCFFLRYYYFLNSDPGLLN